MLRGLAIVISRCLERAVVAIRPPVLVGRHQRWRRSCVERRLVRRAAEERAVVDRTVSIEGNVVVPVVVGTQLGTDTRARAKVLQEHILGCRKRAFDPALNVRIR